MTPCSRGCPRLRACCDCGRQEFVRKDNMSERCRSCASRLSGRRGNEVRRAKRLQTDCAQCGTAFPSTARRLARGADRYCSMECWQRSRRIERTCKFCHAAFTVLVSALSDKTNASGNFCSRGCYHRYLCRTDRVTGRGSRWRAARKEALRRAPFCVLCGTLQRLEVHHVIPFRLTRDNRQTNLVPLCKRHHKVVETIYHDLESVEPDLWMLQFWFVNVLRDAQWVSLFVLKRLSGSSRATTRNPVLAARTAD
jgi:hypothetical protein